MRNDNSSRFGKCITLTVDFRGNLLGGHIQHFLLERVSFFSDSGSECVPGFQVGGGGGGGEGAWGDMGGRRLGCRFLAAK